MTIEIGNLEKNTTDPNWKIYHGDGDRSCTYAVKFTQDFHHAPLVMLAVSSFDIAPTQDARLKVKAIDITEKGFKVVFSTWADTKVVVAGVNWMATDIH